MKRSLKIVVITVVITLVTLITSLLVMRSPLFDLLNRSEIFRHELLDVEPFDKVVFSENWIARIRQDRVFKIGLLPEDSIYRSLIVNRNGTVHFLRDSTLVPNDKKIKVKLTIPSIRSIEMGEGSTLDMNTLKIDTVDITLGDNTTFIGVENQIIDATIKTKGKTLFLLTDDPDL
ncbi:MAG: hypothetical protein JXR07_14250 [Reichenbachiella sp.]